MRLLSARTQLNYPTRLGDDDLETYRLSEITRVDFGGDYENALRLIGGSKYQNAMDLIWGPSNPHKVKRRSWTQARGSMRQDRDLEKFLEQAPRPRKWVHECASCRHRGYEPAAHH
jgi:hypothetical protein